MSKQPTTKMKRRMVVILSFLMLIGFTTVIVRLFYLQIVKGEFYQAKALSQQMRTTTISAKRGTIYDRNMTPLAESANVWTVFISPADIKDEDRDKIADGLSRILEVDREKIIEKSKNKASYYEIVKSKVDRPVIEEIIQFVKDEEVSGINWAEDNKRVYPYGNFASTILGFTNADHQGAYGIEAYYNKILSGTTGRVVAAKNAWGKDMPFGYQEMYEAEDGNSIVLTIDEVIQHFLEKHLETAVVEHQVKQRAVGIIMDVKTGEILAMSTKPDFDPNNPYEILDPNAKAVLASMDKNSEEYKKTLQEAQFTQWRNKAISDPYEPGSVFKVITASAALDTGTSTLNDHYYCPGYHIVGPERISCWKAGGHGSQNFEEAMKHSCNPAFMMIGAKLGAENYCKYFENFGLTKATGIDLPGEAEGIYHSLATLSKEAGVELASSSFGQTFKVTPIQLITAVSAAVNGGKLMQPYVVKQIIDPDGNVIKTKEPVEKRQVIDEETSKTIASIMEKVVSDPDGSGKYAYIPGYRIGGKTGTSEKLDQPNRDANVLSFIGIAPADDPQLACLVLLDEPVLSYNSFGSTIAAPVVGAILADVLDYYGIEPHYTEKELEMVDIDTPDVMGLRPHEAQAVIMPLQLKTKIIGDGGTVIKQIPMAGQPIPKNGTVIIYTTEESISGTITVPNVLGMTGQQANKAITNAGLNIKFSNPDLENKNTEVTAQSIPPDTEVEPGTVITITLIEKEAIG